MTPIYYLWHTARQGWVAPSGTTTDREQASTFPREKAIELARRQVVNNAPVLLPVAIADIAEIIR